MRIVGVADTDPAHVRMARELFGLPPERCFSDAETLAQAEPFADAAINGTMDPLHVSTTLPLLRRGYDVLLEKPFALNQPQADELLACARDTGRRVMVCHVLRYAPFYRRLKELILSGALGRILNIRMAEQVSFFHASVSYVRGKYASPEACGSGMLLSKCCHDIDLLAWLMAESRPARVSSVGSVFQFKPEGAPAGAGEHCLTDCDVERACPYSARRLYLEHPQRWAANIWHDSGLPEDAPLREKERLLASPDSPYGRCVYRQNLRIVDHQSMLVAFENGATATFDMNGGASTASRMIHITGTRGEAAGRFEDGAFTVSLISPESPGGCRVETVALPPEETGDAHGGGDQLLVEDFITLVRGGMPSICCTTLEDSMVGHRLVFRAEDSRAQGGAMLPYLG
jgi:predicted dehydrogenase